MMTETANPTEPVSKPAQITEYVVSWKWLLSGVFLFLLVGSAAGGLYYFRVTHLADHVLRAASQMAAEAEQIRTEFEAETDETKKQTLFNESRKKKEDAAKLLDNFNRSQPGHTAILKELNALLEKLYQEEGGGRGRGAQLANNCEELIKVLASDKEALPYHIRLMELAWDRRDLPQTIARARQVLTTERALNNPENYEALRMIALVSMMRLPVAAYNPVQLQMPFLEDKLDKFLEKLSSI